MNSTAAADNRSEYSTGTPRIIVASKAEGIALCTAFILLFVFIVVGNLLTIVLFAVNRRLRKRSLFLVINMAFADLMLGTVSLPIYITYLFSVYFKFWQGGSLISMDIFYTIADTFFMFATLNSAAFISGERLYAVYWPLRHRTLSMRAYRIAIFTVWILALPITAVWTALKLLISTKHAMYAWMSNTLTLIFIICGCNIGIWRKFQHGVASQHRASQNRRLTKTLLCVSILALLSWLPLLILNCLMSVNDVQIPWRFYYLVNFINYSNSFWNPVVYALRIPEFREVLALCCLRRPLAPNIVDNKSRNNRNLALTPATELRTLGTESSHLKLAFEHYVLDTKL